MPILINAFHCKSSFQFLWDEENFSHVVACQRQPWGGWNGSGVILQRPHTPGARAALLGLQHRGGGSEGEGDMV